MRNNNPLNIIKSERINWQGEVKPSTDPTFAQFETLEYGLRAALKLLRTYYNKHGCKTIRQIVARWDPEGEKIISAYVKTVCQKTGLNPDTPLPPYAQPAHAADQRTDARGSCSIPAPSGKAAD